MGRTEERVEPGDPRTQKARSLKLVISAHAENDILDAAAWYEVRRDGLGQQFLDELDSAFQRVATAPEHFPLLTANVRKAMLRRFPAIYFLPSRTEINVIAVLHQHRRPGTWKRRR